MKKPEAYYKESYRFNYQRFFAGNPQEKLSIILQAEEHILGLQEGKERFIREELAQPGAVALYLPRGSTAPPGRGRFFQAVKARLAKLDVPLGGGKSDTEIETAIKAAGRR